MNDEDLYRDTEIIVIKTPYTKLRERKGWTLEIAADFLQIGSTTLGRYETKKVPVPKYMIKRMDEVYGCNGKLIEYWWNSDLCSLSENGYTARIKNMIKNLIGR